jgi:glycine betaine/choline ABC-type transport system substrate-binding protein
MDRTKVVAVFVLSAWLAGCSKQPKIVVGAKNFTEQNILGEIVAQQVERQLHIPVERRFGLGGTLLAQQAMRSGDLDIYPEYTGTAFANVLKKNPTGPNGTDPAEVLALVRAGYEKWRLEWLDPLGFNNSFAVAVRGEDARSRHLETISDAAHDPGGLAIGVGYEFLGRQDGLPLLTQSYGFRWKGSPRSMDLGLIYEALRQKQVDVIVASATDGMLSVLDTKVLQDDKHIFPPYEACLVTRGAALEATPGLREALTALSGKISPDAMRKMNYEVDGKHRTAADVAREFLDARK